MNNNTLRAMLKFANATVFANHCMQEHTHAICFGDEQEVLNTTLMTTDAQGELQACKSALEHAILDEAAEETKTA